MNKKVKLHKPTSPAFNIGEQWISSSGNKVKIVSIMPYKNVTGKWDYTVTYIQECDGCYIYDRDIWNFQVRYTHVADYFAKGKEK